MAGHVEVDHAHTDTPQAYKNHQASLRNSSSLSTPPGLPARLAESHTEYTRVGLYFLQHFLHQLSDCDSVQVHY